MKHVTRNLTLTGRAGRRGLPGESGKEILGLLGRAGSSPGAGRLQALMWQEIVREELMVAQGDGLPKVPGRR